METKMSWLSVSGLVIAVLLVLAPNGVYAQSDDARVDELERKVDVLLDEIESLKLGAVADTNGLQSRYGMGPAASKVYAAKQGVSIGGYGEMLLERFDAEREDDQATGKPARLDFLRNIFYIGYKFSDDLIFNSEIEIEHAGILSGGSVTVDPATGEGSASLSGEVVLEFAYLDWTLRPELGLRAGMMLLPIGLVNELHEPTVFIGARRPEVERNIIPTTWRGNGAGVFGELENGLSYRAYVTEGLDAAKFSASSGVRSGRQKGSKSVATHPGVSLRLDYEGKPGFLIGGSFYTGNAWQGSQVPGLDPVVTMFDLHARVNHRGFRASALYVDQQLSDAAALSDALGQIGPSRLGERASGYYIDASYDVMQAVSPGSRFSVRPYGRYEQYDTQQDVPGGAANKANDRTNVTIGASFQPHTNVILKLDREFKTNEAKTGTSQWNALLGYVF